MRLSRLHIVGFKSFPDRAELGFDDGVTAIVGPNGCGKSNVVDAITWVLGEQSARSLRGERMEDVIFSGSDMRKPTSAAEVRLKFTEVAQVAAPPAGPQVEELLDDQPIVTRDVEIGRRLYRSGESEYLIDGEVCRLRDVHDLLMDSGLGVKAYAVIEQGKIGQILSSRPAERRMLIEEAAGVTKYKSRRRAAELKLEAAEQNLTRVDDIIFEVEKQRGALRRQAARARRYRRLREDLRTWEQVLFARRAEALGREIAAADARLNGARAREVSAAARVAEVDAALEAARLGSTSAEAAATEAREQAHARELDIGRLQQRLSFDRQQVEELGRQSEAWTAELAELEARQAPAREAITTQETAAARAHQTLDEAARRVEERESAYTRALGEVQQAEHRADAGRQAVLATGPALSALQQARDHAAAARDRVAAERERLAIEARELDAELARVRDEHGQAVRALDQVRAELVALAEQRTALEAGLTSRRQAREAIVQSVAAEERDLAARQARLRSLEELEARRARFGDAARLLLAGADGSFHQHGAVADHLEVERSYERAVDALLGELLEYVLVERTADVTAALQMIGDRDAGRCGFVILEEASRQGTTGSGTSPSGAAPGRGRWLADVVRVRGPHQDAVSRAMAPALVVETFDEARSLSAEVSTPVATMAGDVFRGGWLVQGGARGATHGILETRAEAVELGLEVTRAAARLEASGAELAALDQLIEQDQLALAALVADQHLAEKATVGHDAQIARTTDEQRRVSQRIEVVGTESARTDGEVADADRLREEALVTIGTRERDLETAQAVLATHLTEQQAAREAAEAAMRLVTESRTTQATLVERVAGLDQEVERLRAAASDLQHRIEGRQTDIGRLGDRRNQLRESIVDTERALDETVAALDRIKGDMRSLDERALELRQEVAEREQDIRSARQELETVRGEVMQGELARATASSDLAHLEESCLDAVGLGLQAVADAVARLAAEGALVAPATRPGRSTPGGDEDGDEDEGDPDGGGDEAGGEQAVPTAEGTPAAAGAIPDPEPIIAELRGRIDRLGPVNMMAIEQFDELETRHVFLTTQRQDLLDSIRQTGEAIRKIEQTTRERFAEAFESINRHFGETFSTLFGGGRAGLVLIDQENDAESGIDIIAQPPGKRLQNVQLLSGGEKALTAMALMFAVFKHRPSPFCLLDEIDAPLDDANIGRFVEMLQGMQEHTQFILITHNRRTMEIADQLYGVTMEEPGVSKLISLQLN